MAVSVKSLLFRRGALVAAVTALAIMAARVVGIMISGIVGGLPAGLQFDVVTVSQSLLYTVLPFGIGVFLCLWVILPIAAELEMRFVVSRGLAAAGVGSVLMLATILAVSVVEFVRDAGFLEGRHDRQIETLFTQIEFDSIGAAQDFLVAAPIVILFAIFQWQWLKNHPAKFDVAGILDV